MALDSRNTRTRAAVAARYLFTAATLGLVAAAPCWAQRLRVGAARTSISIDELPRANGISGSLAFPLGRRIDLVFLAQHFSGNGSGVGRVCGGLINPDQCPNELFNRSGSATMGGVGADLSLVRMNRARLTARPEVFFGQLKTHARGLTTANALGDEAGVIGVTGALEVGATPLQRLPFDLVVGVSASRLSPPKSEQAPDRYAPFNRSFSMSQAYAGVAFDFGRGP